MSNNRYIKFLLMTKKWISGKNRNYGWFSLSDSQLRVAAEVQRINGIAAKISDAQTCVLCCKKEAIYEINALLLYTDLRHKKIIALYSADIEGILENCGTALRGIPVTNELGVLKSADFILASDYKNHNKDELALAQKGFGSKVISIYDENAFMPFCCKVNSKQLSLINKRVLSNNPNYVPYVPLTQSELSFLDNINRINDRIAESCSWEDRILIYCAGVHTEALFLFTNIIYYNIIAITDGNQHEFWGINVRTAESTNFEDIDKIVISSRVFQEEIVEYLVEKGQANKIVKLYGDNDKHEFYFTENIYSPDIGSAVEKSEKYQYGEIHRELERCADEFTTNSDYYINYSITRLFGSTVELVDADVNINNLKGYGDANAETAIIVQGPIIYKHDFTYYALRQMRYAFPESTIILSTWKSELDNHAFRKFRNLGIETVFSVPSVNRGLSNINLQIESTYQGLVRAKQLDKKYALKTRTDFLVTNKSAISFLHSMVKEFPISSKAKSRIAIMTCKLDIPWYIPDFVNYGTTDDMLEFWNNGAPFSDINDGRNPEMLLYSRYAKVNGFFSEANDMALSDYFKAICDNFIVFDVSVLNAIWYKYTYLVDYFERDSNKKINFHDWLNYVLKNKQNGDSSGR